MNRRIAETGRKLGVIWLAWTAAGVFYASQDFMTRLYRSEPAPWFSIFAGWMAAMYICAAFTPGILWLGRRWPIERGHRIARVCLHLFFSVIFSIVSAVIEAPVLMALGLFPQPVPTMPVSAAISLLLAYGFHGGVMRYWAVVGLQALFRSHRNAKDRERETLELTVRTSQLAQQLTAAQLGALKMQLQPHFLFNTLGAIMVLVQQHRGELARSMLARLSDLLRLTLEDVNAQEVPLHREMEFLRLYLAIEQVRFEDRLRVQITADGPVADCMVPHMVLQPLVENAVRHGLGRSEEAVLIDIRADKRNDQLVMTVADDGPGSPSGFEMTGIGLANTRERLRHLYGTDAGLRAENRSPHGAQVTVTLPFHLEPMGNGRCS